MIAIVFVVVFFALEAIFGIDFVMFWTDMLLFVLFLSVLMFGLYASTKPHLKRPWVFVLKRKMGMMNVVILSFFCLVTLLDSIHFQVNNKQSQQASSASVQSFLDLMLLPLKNRTEKTYSEPFATHLFVKENIEQDNNSVIRDYPKLKYGGVHLDVSQIDKSEDMINLIIKGLLLGLLFIIFLFGGSVIVLAIYKKQTTGYCYRQLIGKQSAIPWKIFWLTLTIIVLFIAVAASLSQYYHVFGTDKVGQDVLYLTLKSIRTGLVIGSLSTLVMLPFAIVFGIMAGYLKGWVDDVIQYIYTTLNSIPGVLLIAAAVLIVDVYLNTSAIQYSTEERADLRLLFLCIILGITSWTGLCRLLRGETLKVREQDYIAAAKALGVGPFNIMYRHILPNIMHIILISIVLDFSGLVLAEAVLSYVGVGVDPTMNSWGNMINSARLEMAREPVVWWSLLAAFSFMFTLVLSANLFADTVRDAFDPRLRIRT